MLNKLALGVGILLVVVLKVVGTIIFDVQPEIVNTTITGIAFGAGVILVLWGSSERPQ